jgi:hypothetical protein
VERLFFDLETPRNSWRSLALCKQVEQAASHVLVEECEDPCLDGACVVQVQPAAEGGPLVVTVVLAPGQGVEIVPRAFEALTAMSGAFRAAVAGWIHRKRVPELIFRVVLWGGDDAPR